MKERTNLVGPIASQVLISGLEASVIMTTKRLSGRGEGGFVEKNIDN